MSESNAVQSDAYVSPYLLRPRRELRDVLAAMIAAGRACGAASLRPPCEALSRRAAFRVIDGCKGKSNPIL